MKYKLKIVDGIKYDLVESEYSTVGCSGCIFDENDNSKTCQMIDIDNSCLIIYRNAIWKISQSYIRKQKLEKIKSL